MSISWGRRSRFRFHPAGEVSTCMVPESSPAVFAITYKQDAANRPKAHTVLYFGETADTAKDLYNQCKLIKEQWLDKGGNRTELFVFYHGMPSSSTWERSAVREQLIAEYDPLMNSEN